MQFAPRWPLSLSSYWRSSQRSNSVPSSISSSKFGAIEYAKMLGGICAILMIALELGSVYLVKHYSTTFTRVSQQYAEAAKVRPGGPGEPSSVLMLGNSFLLDGVDVDRLRELTSGSVRVYPIFLEGTGYYDWLYGLRRLFSQGARPQVVVIGLEGGTLLSNGVWEESPKLILAARDVLGVASDLGEDRTATSNLMLAHISTFWTMRNFFRRRLLERMVPHFDHLFPFLRASDLSVPRGQEFEAAVMFRLRTLRELCDAHGAKLILVIPPIPSSGNVARRMAMASEQVGVKALVPIDPAALAPGFYEPDAIHLNPNGAVRFTSALAVDLLKAIPTASQHAAL